MNIERNISLNPEYTQNIQQCHLKLTLVVTFGLLSGLIYPRHIPRRIYIGHNIILDA